MNPISNQLSSLPTNSFHPSNLIDTEDYFQKFGVKYCFLKAFNAMEENRSIFDKLPSEMKQKISKNLLIKYFLNLRLVDKKMNQLATELVSKRFEDLKVGLKLKDYL